MKRATATSRCEVGGRVYLPGDDMTVTEAQFAYLKQHGAATEIRMQTHASSAPPSIEDVTIEAAHGAYARKIKARVAKGNSGNGK